MKPVTILLAAAALAASLATATAQSQYNMHPDGTVSCNFGVPHYEQRLDGRMLIVCPPKPISREQADDADRQWLRSHDAEQARQRKRNWDSGACNEKRVPGLMYTRPPNCDD